MDEPVCTSPTADEGSLSSRSSTSGKSPPSLASTAYPAKRPVMAKIDAAPKQHHANRLAVSNSTPPLPPDAADSAGRLLCPACRWQLSTPGLSCDSKWRRSISGTFLISNLSLATGSSSIQENIRAGLPTPPVPALSRHLRFHSMWVAIPVETKMQTASDSNHWITSNGITGSLPAESADHIDRNPYERLQAPCASG